MKDKKYYIATNMDKPKTVGHLVTLYEQIYDIFYRK